MAILVIVAFHAKLPFFDGGFIGVDVFFVISGFLITRNLLDESGSTGKVRLLTFWSKRIRRLVPALALMVAVVLAASILIMPVVDLRDIARQGASAAVYVSNMLFARDAQSYFGSDVERSPFLHTWSLGVEEQFYLVWPVLVAAVTAITIRSRHRRKLLAAAFGVILVLSFGLNLRLSGNSTWAFFGLPARAWEFAGAGLLAMVLAARHPSTAAVRWAFGVVGLALVAGATVLFSASPSYPGAAALVPVIGTMLLIAAGAGLTGPATGITRALGVGPMQWIGRVSYSWYLWHWPFIILLVQFLGRDKKAIRVAAVVVSLPVAYLALRFIENPLRFRPRLVGSVRRTFALGALATVAALLVAGGTVVAAEHKPTSNLDEQLAVVSTDFFPRCQWTKTTGGVDYCEEVGSDASDVLVVMGDSHASVWFNETAEVAHDHGLRLVLYTKQGCPAIDVDVRPGKGGTPTEECRKSHEDRKELIEELKPKGVILVETNDYLGSILDASGKAPEQDEQVDLWRTGLTSFVEEMKSQGVPMGLVLDNPKLSESATVCIGRERSIDACRTPRTEAMRPIEPLRDVEIDVADQNGIATLDPVPLLCGGDRCLLEVDGKILYIDDNHLANVATKLFSDKLDQLVGPGAACPDAPVTGRIVRCRGPRSTAADPEQGPRRLVTVVLPDLEAQHASSWG